jgi:hypothetical protein
MGLHGLLQGYLYHVSPKFKRPKRSLLNAWTSPSLNSVSVCKKKGMLLGYWWKSQKETGHWEDLDVSGRIILK